jgi:hypothetical protein
MGQQDCIHTRCHREDWIERLNPNPMTTKPLDDKTEFNDRGGQNDDPECLRLGLLSYWTGQLDRVKRHCEAGSQTNESRTP